jgi:hypothetical protein
VGHALLSSAVELALSLGVEVMACVATSNVIQNLLDLHNMKVNEAAVMMALGETLPGTLYLGNTWCYLTKKTISMVFGRIKNTDYYILWFLGMILS